VSAVGCMPLLGCATSLERAPVSFPMRYAGHGISKDCHRQNDLRQVMLIGREHELPITDPSLVDKEEHERAAQRRGHIRPQPV
jgi:hypothetical protein